MALLPNRGITGRPWTSKVTRGQEGVAFAEQGTGPQYDAGRVCLAHPLLAEGAGADVRRGRIAVDTDAEDLNEERRPPSRPRGSVAAASTSID